MILSYHGIALLATLVAAQPTVGRGKPGAYEYSVLVEPE